MDKPEEVMLNLTARASMTIENIITIRQVEKMVDRLNVAGSEDELGVSDDERHELMNILAEYRERMEFICEEEIPSKTPDNP